MTRAAPNTIGVVLLNWNNAHETLECLDSLAATTPGPGAVVVVDNASRDDSVDRLAAWCRERGIGHVLLDEPAAAESAPSDGAWLMIVRATANRGFAGGNNVGLEYLARSPAITHYLLLNNDTSVAPSLFAAFAAALDRAPNAGLLTGTIFVASEPTRVWYAGGHFLHRRALVLHDYDVPPGDGPVPTAFVSGCAMLISREAVRRVGLLAECYFPLYLEDAEYSFRVAAAGLPVLYAPRAIVYHKVGATVGHPTTSPLVAYCQPRHRAFFVRRNLRGWDRVAGLLYLAASKPARALLETVAGRPRIGWAVLRGTLAGLFSRAAWR